MDPNRAPTEAEQQQAYEDAILQQLNEKSPIIVAFTEIKRIEMREELSGEPAAKQQQQSSALASGEVSPDSEEDEESRFVQVPYQVTGAGLRTSRDVLHRQLLPLYEAKSTAQLGEAIVQAEQNLNSLGIFKNARVDVIPLFTEADVVQKMHVPGNQIDEIEDNGRNIVQPSLLYRGYRALIQKLGVSKHKTPSAAAAATGASDEAAEEDDEDEDDDDDMPPGGMFVSGAQSPTSPSGYASARARQARMPVKVSVLLQEKGVTGLKYNINVSLETGAPEHQLSFAQNNRFGLGEKFELQWRRSLTNASENQIAVSYSQPDVLSLGSTNYIRLFQHELLMAHASSAEKVKGMNIGWTGRGGRHAWSYNLSQRDLKAVCERVEKESWTSRIGYYPFKDDPDTIAPLPSNTPLAPLPNTSSSVATSLPSTSSSSSSSSSAASESAAAGAMSAPGSFGSKMEYPPIPRFQDPSPSILQLTSPGLFSQLSSLKSSLKYTFTHSSLDQEAVPRQGFRIVSGLEAAGVGGVGAQFLRSDVELKKFVSLTEHFSLGFGLHSSYVHHLPRDVTSPKDWRPFLSDRLWILQPLLLRGHPQAAVGPKDGKDNLGGEFLLSAGVSAHFSLPVKALRENGVRGHAFWNIGNVLGLSCAPSGAQFPYPAARYRHPALGCLPRSAPFSTKLEEFIDSSRQSVGFGIVLPTPIGRFEFNVAQPLDSKGAKAGKWKPEFGIGYQYI